MPRTLGIEIRKILAGFAIALVILVLISSEKQFSGWERILLLLLSLPVWLLCLLAYIRRSDEELEKAKREPPFKYTLQDIYSGKKSADEVAEFHERVRKMGPIEFWFARFSRKYPRSHVPLTLLFCFLILCAIYAPVAWTGRAGTWVFMGATFVFSFIKLWAEIKSMSMKNG